MNLAAEANKFFDQGIEDGSFKVDRYQVEKARAALVAYFLHYGDESSIYDVVGVEVPYSLPLPEVEENHMGFIDYILRRKYDKKIVVADLKTATNPGNDYWQELYTNEQLTEYTLALRQSGYEEITIRWDVIVKPSISPKKLTKDGISELESGHYCGLPCSDTTVAEDKQESPVQYGVRCLQWYLENTDAKFFRRTYTRNEQELIDHIDNVQSRVERNKSWESDFKGFNILPVKHLEKCKRYGNMCEYHAICSGADPEKKQYRPKEAPKDRVKLDGFSVSKLRCSDNCPREYHYKYIEKIEPIIQPPREALDFGSLVHSGFEYIMRKQMEGVQDLVVLPTERGK